MKLSKENIKIDPRRSLLISSFTNPDSDTFGNLRLSALKAKYSKSTAEQYHITGRPEWLPEALAQRTDMVKTAERRLKETLEMDIDLNGKNGLDLKRLQVDVSKFITERLASGIYGKEKEAAKQTNIQVNIVNYGSTKPHSAPLLTKHDEVIPLIIDVVDKK